MKTQAGADPVTSNILLLGLPTPGLTQLADSLGISPAEDTEIRHLRDHPLAISDLSARQISQSLAKTTKNRNYRACLMVYAAPADFLARQITSATDVQAASEDAGITAFKALQFWRDYHYALLEQYRQIEETTLLINGDRAIALDPLVMKLSKAFGAQVSHPARAPAWREEAQAIDHQNHYLQVIDTLAPECLELYTELESCAELFGREPEFGFSGLDQRQTQPLKLLQLLVQQRRIEQTLLQHGMDSTSLGVQLNALHRDLKISADTVEQYRGKLATSQTEIRSLQERYTQLESRVSASESEVARITKERNQVQQLSKQLNEKVSAIETDKKSLQSENDRLLQQLHQVQKELERYYQLHQKSDQQVQALRKELDARTGSPMQSPGQNGHKTKAGIVGFAMAPLRIGGALFGAAGKRKRAIKRDAKVLRQSGTFDEQWYLRQYPDVAQAGFDPIVHYLKFGATEGRNPSVHFDTRWYLASNPDVAETAMNPLLHYVKFGKDEGRQPMRLKA